MSLKGIKTFVTGLCRRAGCQGDATGEPRVMDLLEFRQLVRRVLGPGIPAHCESYILSIHCALASPAQQAACVAAVEADLKALAAEPTETP